MALHKKTTGDIVFRVINYTFLILLTLAFVIPFLLIFGTSFVTKQEIAARGFVFFPNDWDFSAYKLLLSSGSDLLRSYGVTIFRIVVGTALNLLVTGGFAYAISKKRLPGRSFLIGMAFVTMVFGGGLIPTYMVVDLLGLVDSVWALIIPSLLSVWNMLILRNFFSTIPESLEESAFLDGATPIQIFFKIIIPLSAPALATIGLFYAVDHWNAWFDAAIYLNDPHKYPVQLVLRKYVMNMSYTEMKFDLAAGANPPDTAIKSAVIVISTFPILCIYPFVQKYFVKGVMVGSVKG